MHSDPIADLLTRIRNGQKARHTSTQVPYSRIKHDILKVLVKRKFIESTKKETKEGKSSLEIVFSTNHPALSLKRVSKPGRRMYKKQTDITPICSGLGIAILSTSQGVIHHIEAKRKGIGGEILCEVF